MKSRPEQIKAYIIKHVNEHPHDIVIVTEKAFNVSRTTVHRHINTLIKQNRLFKRGKTQGISYYTANSVKRKLSYAITRSLHEAEILQSDFNAIFLQFNENIYDICCYGLTEIVNNAIDHSGGKRITIETYIDGAMLVIEIVDDGVGVFKHIMQSFKLSGVREAVLHLSKGKLTTMPQHHSGEGVFFCSRAFDAFDIYANRLHYVRNNKEDDWGLESTGVVNKGSRIVMQIDRSSNRTLVETFQKYQGADNFAFERTDILVALAEWGDEVLMSRSQAKRIIVGLEKFNQITLDFRGIRLVGQGFVDELFRVYPQSRTNLTIHYIHANEDVTFMIERSLAN